MEELQKRLLEQKLQHQKLQSEEDARWLQEQEQQVVRRAGDAQNSQNFVVIFSKLLTVVQTSSLFNNLLKIFRWLSARLQ